MLAFSQLWQPLRRRVQAITLLFLVTISGLVATTLVATFYLGYLLERSEKSNQQLQALQRLHGDIHQHFSRQMEQVLSGRATLEPDESTGQIRKRFQAMVEISKQEATLVNRHERGAELAEIANFQRIQHELSLLLSAAGDPPAESRNDIQARLLWYSGTVLALYQQNLQPLLDAALADEESELAAVKLTQSRLRQRIHGIVILMVGISIAGALTLSILLSRLLLKPLQALTQATDSIAAGRLDTRVSEQPGAEFARLTQHFNVMAARLEQQNVSLEEQNNLLEQKVAERTTSLRASNERLRRVDLNRRRFLEDVSHELRTPLTVLLGEADVTLRAPHPDMHTYRLALQTVQAHAGFLERRISDLMALTRAEDGCLSLVCAPVDLKALVEQTVEALLPLARINALNLFAETPQHVPLIWGDASWLRQLLLTLVDNAVKFSNPNGDVSLCLQVEVEYLRLSVLDAGNGVTTSALPHLFERYYQADPARAGSGFGLGLAIASWIVTQHQGTIHARNREGKGLCIEAHFPIRTDFEEGSDEKNLTR